MATHKADIRRRLETLNANFITKLGSCLTLIFPLGIRSLSLVLYASFFFVTEKTGVEVELDEDKLVDPCWTPSLHWRGIVSGSEPC